MLRLFRDATIERTRDAALLVESGEEGLTALVTAEAIELRLPTVVWLTPYTPELRSRFWKRFPWSRLDATEGLPAVVQRARDARAREFKPCRACGERTPREAREMSVFVTAVQASSSDVCAETEGTSRWRPWMPPGLVQAAAVRAAESVD
ncbi:MAG: hypothetical protein ACJ79U_05760 [Myxococcales bacterium]